MWNRVVVAVNIMLFLAATAYFVHGANQVGIMDGLILDRDAWDDPGNGIAFMIAGGVLMLGIVLLVLLIRVNRIARRLSDRRGPHA